MKDGKTDHQDWISMWIAQQRELLEQQAATGAGHHRAEEIGQQWAALGQSFTAAWNQTLGSGSSTGEFDPFNIGNAMLSAWNAASVVQSGFASQAAEVLGRLPPIGLAREQTEAWREVTAAHAECKRIEREVRSLLHKVQLDALDLLERRVRERSTAEPIENFRTLYDMWVECGEQVYSKLAHSESYAKLQAELGNATMRLRARVQTVVEHSLKQFDLPTRSELNSVHRQIRDLRSQIESLQEMKQAAERPKPRRTARKKAKSKASKR